MDAYSSANRNCSEIFLSHWETEKYIDILTKSYYHDMEYYYRCTKSSLEVILGSHMRWYFVKLKVKSSIA